MKTKIMAVVVGALFLSWSSNVNSQSVSINADGADPNANAMLDVVSPSIGNGKGLLIPRVTEAQRTTASSSIAGGLLNDSGELRGGAAQGLTVYQTDGTQGFYYNTSTTAKPTWVYIGTGSGTVTSVIADAPLTGGTITETGNIGINKANATTDGYLSKEDWATFNGKSNLALGETDTTAYRGDRGKSAYDATQAATNTNTASTIVKRDASGNFSAGTITANLTGNVTGNADTATTAGNVTGTVAIANGGTGATSAGGALTNLGIDQIATKKSNLSANSAPTVNDDSTKDYAVGSQWLDTTADKSYICLDATAGAAVWKDTTASGGTVTSITATSPLTGGEIKTSGTIGINKANSATDGYLSKEDWATFNGKGTSNLELGETETTAYRGDRGKSAYDATQAATSEKTANTIVKRDESGGFYSGMIHANLTGNVTGNLTGNVTGNLTGNADTATTAQNVTGVVAVSNGGTGANNATSARTNLGLGTISTQNSDNVAITGGAINGTTIGAISTAQGAFTDVSVGNTNAYFVGTAKVLHKGKDALEGNIIVGNGGNNITQTTSPEGTFNIFIGQDSGRDNTKGYYNTAIGSEALLQNTTGYENTAIGYNSLFFNTTGYENVAIGSEAMYANKTGLSNVAIGFNSLYQAESSSYNVAIGANALHKNESDYNIGIGYNSLTENTNGTENIAVGSASLKLNTSGSMNTALGNVSLNSNETGSQNTAIGYKSLFNSTSSYNSALGSKSLYSVTTGGYNTGIGYQAGANITSGEKNTFIGCEAGTDGANMAAITNSIAIGYQAKANANNQVVIGNGLIESFFCHGAYNSTTSETSNLYVNSMGQIMRSTSSARYKTDITDIEVDSSKIYDLRPVSFTGKKDGKRHFGLIAEEVAEVIPELAEYAKAKDVIPERTDDELVPDSVKYPLLPVLMLNEMKKLKAENEELKAELKAIKEKLGMK